MSWVKKGRKHKYHSLKSESSKDEHDEKQPPEMTVTTEKEGVPIRDLEKLLSVERGRVERFEGRLLDLKKVAESKKSTSKDLQVQLQLKEDEYVRSDRVISDLVNELKEKDEHDEKQPPEMTVTTEKEGEPIQDLEKLLSDERGRVETLEGQLLDLKKVAKSKKSTNKDLQVQLQLKDDELARSDRELSDIMLGKKDDHLH